MCTRHAPQADSRPDFSSWCFMFLHVQEHLAPAVGPSASATQRFRTTTDTAGAPCSHAHSSHSDSAIEPRPRYLHESTALALGLDGGAVPSLLEAVLGEGALDMHSRKLRALLQHPPPASGARLVHKAIGCARRCQS